MASSQKKPLLSFGVKALLVVLVPVLGALLLVVWFLPQIVSFQLKGFLERKGVIAEELEIKSIRPWIFETDSVKLSHPNYGAQIAFDRLEVTFGPRRLVSNQRLDSITFQKPVVDFSLDRFMENQTHSEVMDNAETAGARLGVPLLLPVDAFTVNDGRARLDWRGEMIELDGSLNLLRLDQTLGLVSRFSIPAWEVEGQTRGVLDEATWRFSHHSQVLFPDPLLAMDWAEPEWKRFLPLGVELRPGVTQVEIQARGGVDTGYPQVDALDALVLMESATVQFEATSFTSSGLSGAVFLDPGDIASARFSIFGVVEAISPGAGIDVLPFPFEADWAACSGMAGVLGPLQVQHPLGALTATLDMTLDGAYPRELIRADLNLSQGEFIIQRDGLDIRGQLRSDLSTREEGTDRWSGRFRATASSVEAVCAGTFVEGGDLNATIDLLPIGLNEIRAALGSEDYSLEALVELARLGYWDLRGVIQSISKPGLGELKAVSFSLDTPNPADPRLNLKVEVGEADVQGNRVRDLMLTGNLGLDHGSVNLNLNRSPGERLTAQANYRSLEDGGTAIEFSLPPYRFESDPIVGVLVPALGSGTLTGEVELTVDSTYLSRDEITGKAIFSGSDLSLSSDTLGLSLSGGEVLLELSHLLPLRSLPIQRFYAELIQFGQIELRDVETLFELRSHTLLWIRSFSAHAFGGRVEAKDIEMDLNDLAVDLDLSLEKVSLEELVALSDQFPGEATGVVDGRIRARWRNNSIEIGTSFLDLAASGDSVLKLSLDGKEIEPGEPGYLLLQNLGSSAVAVESLRHVQVEYARLDLFNPGNADSPNRLQLKGISLSVDPIAPIDLTVNLRGDVKESIEQFIDIVLNR